MNNFIKDIKKILVNLLNMDDFGIYSDKKLDSGIQTSRAIKCFKNTKDASYYLSKYNGFELDKREFIRIIIEIPCKNNVRSQNIELVLNYLRELEKYFIFTDYIKLYFGDGLIHIDTYRVNKFTNELLNNQESENDR